MPTRAKAGFTLVELLVVIGIIALLAGLLFPAIQSVRANARSTHCQSNMRQLLIALHLYEQDMGVLPVVVPGAGSKPSVSLVNAIQSRIENDKVFHCPAHRARAEEESAADAAGRQTCYKYNDSDFIKGKALDNPALNVSATVLLIDSMDWEPRHSGGANLGFADGHVEWHSKDQYNGPDPMKAGNIGWYNWGKK